MAVLQNIRWSGDPNILGLTGMILVSPDLGERAVYFRPEVDDK